MDKTINTSASQDIAQEKSDKKRKKGERTSFQHIMEALAIVLNGKAAAISLPPINERFFTYSPFKDSRILIEEVSPGVMEIASMDRVVRALTRYNQTPEMRKLFWDELPLPPNKLELVVRHWFNLTEPIPEPKAVSWLDDPTPTFRKLPFVKNPSPVIFPDDFPTWTSLLARMHESKAFECFIGSLFDPNANHHQYLWLSGAGHDGKSAIGRFLKEILGGAASYLQPPGRDDKFWNSHLLGKRLIIFGDCNNRSFVTSGFFKSLVGRDGITVERKYETPFSFIPNAFYMFFSNETPNISNESADKRRIIPCEFHTPGKFELGFEERLLKEAPFFLAHCVQCYAVHIKSGAIPVGKESINTMVSFNEEYFEAVFEDNFVKVPVPDGSLGRLPQSEYDPFKGCLLSPIALQRHLRGIFPTRKEQDLFRHWLAQSRGIRKTAIKRHDKENKVSYYYPGLRLKISTGLASVAASSGDDDEGEFVRIFRA